MRICQSGGSSYQYGSSIRGFSGPEYQRGGKWNMGRFIWRHAKPLLSYLGKRALSTGVDITRDIAGGRDPLQATKEHLISTGKDMAVDGLDRLKERIQTGKGRRRKKSKSLKSRRPVAKRTVKKKVVRRKTRKSTVNKTKRRTSAPKRRRRTRKSLLKTIFD